MSSYPTYLSENGRILIPAPLRKKLKFNVGEKLLVRQIGGHLEVFSATQGVEMAQTLIKAQLKKGATSLARELINDRRKESEND